MPKYMPRSSSSSSNIDDSAMLSRRESTVTLQYPLLTKTNYAAWSMKMQVFMEAQGVWEAIESEETVEIRKDKMAMAAIFQGISEETMLQLGVRKTAKDAWEALQTMHLGAARVKEVRAQSLRWDLESLRMRESESVDEFTGKISTIVSKLRGLGEKVDETYVVKKMLRTVSPKFVQIASTIEEFGDLKTKTIEEVIGSLKAHEERLKGHEENHEEKVLLTRAEWKKHDEVGSSNSISVRDDKSSPRQGRGGGHGASRGRGRGRHDRGRGAHDFRGREPFDIKKIRCFNCNEYGHFASNCDVKPKEEEVNLNVEDEPTLL